MPVDIPPETIENVEESPGRISIDSQAAGHGTVNVLMGIDKSRHDQSAMGIYIVSLFILLPHRRQRSDITDDTAVHNYGSIMNQSTFFRTRHNRTISKK